jgi:hypothetical protein
LALLFTLTVVFGFAAGLFVRLAPALALLFGACSRRPLALVLGLAFTGGTAVSRITLFSLLSLTAGRAVLLAGLTGFTVHAIRRRIATVGLGPLSAGRLRGRIARGLGHGV